MAIARYILLSYHHYLNDCTMQDCGVKKVYGAKLIFVVHKSWVVCASKIILMMCVSLHLYSSIQETLGMECDDNSKYKNSGFWHTTHTM